MDVDNYMKSSNDHRSTEKICADELKKKLVPRDNCNKIDAAVDYRNGAVYLFNGDQYMKYDKSAGKRVGNIPSIHQGWGVPADWNKVTAAVDSDNGVVNLFNGDRYIKYDK